MPSPLPPWRAADSEEVREPADGDSAATPDDCIMARAGRTTGVPVEARAGEVS